MRKRLCCLLMACVLLFGIALPVYAVAWVRYTDPATQATFDIPSDWTQGIPATEGGITTMVFTVPGEDYQEVFLISVDMLDSVSPTERAYVSRSDFNNDPSIVAAFTEQFGIPRESLHTAIYGGHKYYVYEWDSSENYGEYDGAFADYYIRMNNGYTYMFIHLGMERSDQFPAFERILSSAKYPLDAGNLPGVWRFLLGYGYFDLAPFLLILLATITVYSLPFLIYRYGIRKTPVDKRTARRVTMVVAVIALAIAAGILLLHGPGLVGVVVVLWSWVNYRILVGGRAANKVSFHAKAALDVDAVPSPNGWKRPAQTPPTGHPTAPPAMGQATAHRPEMPLQGLDGVAPSRGEGTSTILLPTETEGTSREPSGAAPSPDRPPVYKFCRKCGAELPRQGSRFCIRCGTPVIQEETK